jgi:hypothetical protein
MVMVYLCPSLLPYLVAFGTCELPNTLYIVLFKKGPMKATHILTQYLSNWLPLK